jgi:hypothetical protein
MEKNKGGRILKNILTFLPSSQNDQMKERMTNLSFVENRTEVPSKILRL